MKKSIEKVLFFITCGLLVTALGTHLSTFAGFDPQEGCPGLWYFLQYSSAVFFAGSFVFFPRKDGGPGAGKFLTVWALLFFAATVYAIFNFLFTSIILGENCVPAIVNGQYALMRHGKLIRAVSDAEVIRHQVFQTRAYSGHWMCFFLLGIGTLYKRMTMAGAVYENYYQPGSKPRNT
jgi:hypothetical protein